MEYQLLRLALSALCFAIALVINVLDPNLLLRSASFLVGFLSGFFACHAIGCMAKKLTVSAADEKANNGPNPSWPESEDRIDIIGSNGNDGYE